MRILLSFFLFATGSDVFKVFGTDSYHPSRVFEQKYQSVRVKNSRPLYEAVTSKSADKVVNENKPQIVWKRTNGQMGWTMQSKVSGEWVISFVSRSDVRSPVNAADWLYLSNIDGEFGDEVVADHITLAAGNVKKSDVIQPGMLQKLHEEVMFRGSPLDILAPPVALPVALRRYTAGPVRTPQLTVQFGMNFNH